MVCHNGRVLLLLAEGMTPKSCCLQQEQVGLTRFSDALSSGCQQTCCSTGMRDQLSTSISPLYCRYDKFSVDITEQVGADLEGQHELTVEVFDPTGASKARRYIGIWVLASWGWALLCVGRAGCILMPYLGGLSSAVAIFSCPQARCDTAISCPHAQESHNNAAPQPHFHDDAAEAVHLSSALLVMRL